MQTVEVLLPVSLDRTFDYQLTQLAEVGQRVSVPFGNSKVVVGLIVSICKDDTTERDYEMKSVIDVLDEFPVVNIHWWNLLRFAAQYYVEPLGKALKNAFPRQLHQMQPLTLPVLEIFAINEVGRLALENNTLAKNASRQRALLELLAKDEKLTRAELREHGCTKADIDKALGKHYLCVDEISPYQENQPVQRAQYDLNDEQQQVIQAIQITPGNYSAHLIEGVTGSGKTEVYIQLIEEAIKNNGQVLLLVPEIGLTPQMLARFSARFGRRVSTYHSGMTDIQRRDVFLSAMSGDLPIVIGTRSAIFVPIPNLQLILIDEEHDLSYKQQDGFLYNARDLALFRAAKQGIKIVMGSATPSLESLKNGSVGKLYLHFLNQRATSVSLPSIHIVDRRGHSKENVLADKVIQQMRHTLQRGEQVLLFLNRRGFSPVMGCGDCDWRSDCPACSVFQTVHIKQRQLCCHHCGHSQRLPLVCPKCSAQDIYFMGAGTEKLESQLQQQFPNQQILRLDRDNQTTAKQLDEALDRIHSEEIDIILGTQLIVKGHHFPKVTMVCVVDADGALFSSDFRAEERLYQQLIQVAGRAGRERAGHVYIQSGVPDHPVFHALVRNDYQAYAQVLLDERKQLLLPPYCAQALIKASARSQDILLAYLRALKQALSENNTAVDLLGPVPLAIEKVNHRYHAQLWLSATDKKTLQQSLPLLEKIIQHYDRTNRYKTIIDVDAL